MSTRLARVYLILAGLVFSSIAGISQTTVAFTVEQDSFLTANAGEDSIVRNGTDLTIGSNPTAKGGTGVFQYEWMKGDSLISMEANPVVRAESDVIYTLKVTDSKGCTSQDTIKITLDVSGYDTFSENGIKVYPNPAEDWFAVETGGRTCMVTLIRPDGSLFWTKEITGKGSFETPEIPGIYLIKVEDNKEVKVSKIIFE